MEQLGFERYVPDLRKYHEKYIACKKIQDEVAAAQGRINQIIGSNQAAADLKKNNQNVFNEDDEDESGS